MPDSAGVPGIPGAAVAFGSPRWSQAQAIVGVTVTTVGGVAMTMAFLAFGKRRRDGTPTADDDTLHAAAGSLALAPAVAAVMPTGVSPAPVLPADAELAIPRWRRASLLEARKADPIRAPLGPVVSLTFEHGLVAPLEGFERRTIRYRVVRLLDSPDELTAQEVGVLDQGDEVQLLERSGPYWLVLVPDGRRGWLHRMTLGDVVAPSEPLPTQATRPAVGWDDPYGGRLAAVASAASVSAGVSAGVSSGASSRPDDPPPEMATAAAVSETDIPDDVDPDVLEAFLRSIGRA